MYYVSSAELGELQMNCSSFKNVASLARNSFQFGSTNIGPASSHKYQDVFAVELYTVKPILIHFLRSDQSFLDKALNNFS